MHSRAVDYCCRLSALPQHASTMTRYPPLSNYVKDNQHASWVLFLSINHLPRWVSPQGSHSSRHFELHHHSRIVGWYIRFRARDWEVIPGRCDLCSILHRRRKENGYLHPALHIVHPTINCLTASRCMTADLKNLAVQVVETKERMREGMQKDGCRNLHLHTSV